MESKLLNTPAVFHSRLYVCCAVTSDLLLPELRLMMKTYKCLNTITLLIALASFKNLIHPLSQPMWLCLEVVYNPTDTQIKQWFLTLQL